MLYALLILVVVVPYLPAIGVLKRAGYSGWLYFLFLIPIVNIVWLWIFAFAEWPKIMANVSDR